MAVCSCAAIDTRNAGLLTAATRTAPAKTDPFLMEEGRAMAAELPGIVRVQAPGRAVIQPASYAEEASIALPDRGMRHPEQAMGDGRASSAVQWTAAEERVPATPLDNSAALSQAELAQSFPDEYLFDGGDRGLPIHFRADGIQGVESEDAVVQYNDDEGKLHVKPTNRVAIYAPRFSAVTSVSAPVEGVAVGRLAGNNIVMHGNGLRSRQSTTWHEQREGTERLLVRSRVSGMESEAGQHTVAAPLLPAMNEQALRTAGTVAFLRTGQFVKTEEAQLALGIQSAVTWTRQQNPMIAAKLENAGEVRIRASASQYVGLELPLRRKGELRIVKLADKKIAAPGEIVTFTIRYDNFGDREVRDVAITDNLTPRLEYVDDSATCDRDGVLDTTDNGEGSLVLRWILDQPLPGRKGGVVTFKARVK